MALTKYKYNGYIVSQFDDVNTDFPAEGLPISDVTIIGVSQEANDVTVEVTFSSKTDIINGDAIWITYESSVGANGGMIVLDPAPNGVRLSNATGRVWVKGG